VHVERQRPKLRRRTWMSVDVSFQGTAIVRRENRGAQFRVGSELSLTATADIR